MPRGKVRFWSTHRVQKRVQRNIRLLRAGHDLRAFQT
jgi:hypothetical protein